MADHINGVIAFQGHAWDLRNSWMAFRLEDGYSNGDVYDSKRAAVRHVPNEKHFAFFSFRNAPGGVTAFDCQLFLDVHRNAYEYGNSLHDPDDIRGGRNLIPTVRGYEKLRPRPSELWTP